MIKIGDKKAKEGKVFIIAEIAGGHSGDTEIANKLINIAFESNADAVKLHMYSLDDFLIPSHKLYKKLKKNEFNKNQWKKLFEQASKKNLKTISVTYDLISAKLASELNTDAYYLYPSCTDDFELIEEIAKQNKPIFIQAGGNKLEEVAKAIDKIKEQGNNNIIIVHGFQAFPTKLKDLKLNRLKLLKEKFNLPIAIEDHAEGGSKFSKIAPLISLSYGICSIIKHFTIDRDLKLMDHESSLNPLELKEFVETVREAEKVIGLNEPKEFSKDEEEYRNRVRKRIIAKKEIKKGEIIEKQNIVSKLAPEGIFHSQKKEILGKISKRNIQKNESIILNDVE
jgi:N,N'-diacetyllegionaminate synthase